MPSLAGWWRLITWLAIGLAWAVVFFVIVWPMVLVYAAAAGIILGAVAALWTVYVRRINYPRARALDPVERTWRRFE